LAGLATGILKNTTGTGVPSIAVSGSDYAPATSGSSILYGNSAGGFNNVTIGSGVAFSGGTLSATGNGGTVTTVSVTTANGVSGTVATSTTTPAISLTLGDITPSKITALNNTGSYQAIIGRISGGDRVGIAGQATGDGVGFVFFDVTESVFRPSIFDASSHSFKISGVATTSITSTGFQGAIGASTPSTGAFTTLGSSSTTTLNGTTIPASSTLLVSGGALGTPASGTVTNLTGTASININGTVGATTANTGAFTTVTATGTISTSGGSLETSRTGAVDAFVRISADAGRSKNLSLNTSGARRWTVSSNSTAESGSNAGSDFVVTAYSDADASLGSALTITRSNRSAVFAGGINSTAIGGSTAAAGAFTTLSASGQITSTATGEIFRAVAAGVADKYGTISNTNGSLEFGVNISGNAFFAASAGDQILLTVAGTPYATISSTGLAVSGALSATGNLTLSATNSNILGGTTTGSSSIYNSTGASGITIYGPTHATKANQIDVFAGGLGHTFSSTGFAVSGALSSTGGISSSFAGVEVFKSTSSGFTNSTRTIAFTNAAGNDTVNFGVAGSTYSSLGISANDGYIYSPTPFSFSIGGSLVTRTSSTGLAVTGALSSTGALAIGNTVAAAVAVASTHKVTIVIGGVTYYLLATNVP